jgi:hypothetical protein
LNHKLLIFWLGAAQSRPFDCPEPLIAVITR